MPGRYQQILQRLRLLVLCLTFAVAFEPPVKRFEVTAPAAAMASSLASAARGGLAARGVGSRGAERPLEARVEALPERLSSSKSQSLVGHAPPFDGRHLYLTYRVLLC